jgi:hypothetical protein
VAYSGVRRVKLIEFYGVVFAAPWLWDPRGFDEPPFTFASFSTNPALSLANSFFADALAGA